MDVVVDHPGRVLKVEPLGQHIGRDQDASLFLVAQVQFRVAHVVVGREATDDFRAVLLRGAVHLLQAVDARGSQLPLEIARRVGELREDENLLVRQRLGLQQTDELSELVVVPRLELAGLVQELVSP